MQIKHSGTLIIALIVLLPHTINAEMMDLLKQKYQRPSFIPYPDDNPYSEAKEKLGKTLFFDTTLSDNNIACASCHQPNLTWADGLQRPRSVNVHGKKPRRKTMSLLNVAWDEFYLWDGRASSLEQQAVAPFTSIFEMNRPLHDMIAALAADTDYQRLFDEAFPAQHDAVNQDNFARAIATFERSIVSGITAFDEWVMGDDNAISDSAKQGFILFNGKANCAACHSGWRFTDGAFHDIGINDKDIGRGAIMPDADMLHAFKTPSLREVMKRAPYMHNGEFADLEAVLDHYDNGFMVRPSLDKEMRPLFLTKQERAQLIVFLQILSVD
ncbi:MAG: c-type cytochrome [Alphaproteobacteria bacterium]|nr:c-type cytochrome [Alphaproteobacteria bacterium]